MSTSNRDLYRPYIPPLPADHVEPVYRYTNIVPVYKIPLIEADDRPLIISPEVLDRLHEKMTKALAGECARACIFRW